MDQILCALFHKHIIVVVMNDVLDKKIENVLDQADRMFIATSVGGNSSGASVFFSRDGEDLVCLLYTSPSPRDISGSRMPSSA